MDVCPLQSEFSPCHPSFTQFFSSALLLPPGCSVSPQPGLVSPTSLTPGLRLRLEPESHLNFPWAITLTAFFLFLVFSSLVYYLCGYTDSICGMWDLRLHCGTQDLLVGACGIFFFLFICMWDLVPDQGEPGSLHWELGS